MGWKKEIEMNNNTFLTFMVLFVLLFISVTTNSQNQPSKRYHAFDSNRFNRINSISFNQINISNFFPNNVGDFWEFIEEDITTLFGQFYALKFSVSREVVNEQRLDL